MEGINEVEDAWPSRRADEVQSPFINAFLVANCPVEATSKLKIHISCQSVLGRPSVKVKKKFKIIF